MKLSLVYTNICNIDCRHCYIRGRDPIGIVMPRHFLDAAVKLGIKLGARRLTISGGEPTLFWSDMSDAVKKATQAGMECSLATNGWWANSREEAHALLQKMRESGIRVLELSTDVYHREYIPFGNIRNCIEEGRCLGIRTDVVACSDNLHEETPFLTVISKWLNGNGDRKSVV